MKRVTFVCLYDWASVANRLAEAVRTNPDIQGWDARCVTINSHNLEAVRDIVWAPDKRDEVQTLLDTTDFLVYGSSFADSLPPDVDEPKDVVRGLWHGGSQYRLNWQYYNQNVHPSYDLLFAHRDLVGIDPRMKRLDQPYDVEKIVKKRKPVLPPSDMKWIVGHSPSDEGKKGTYYFTSAMGHLSTWAMDQPLEVESLLLRGLNPTHVEAAKDRIHIFFDQIGNQIIPPGGRKYYGLSLVESASRGSVCMAWSDFEDTPILEVNTDEDIQETVKRLVKNPEEWERLSVETERWALQTHSYHVLSEMFIGYLEDYEKGRE